MSVELIHLLFAVAGAGLGWLLRHKTQVPPSKVGSILAELENVLQGQSSQQAVALAQQLLAALQPPPQPPPK